MSDTQIWVFGILAFILLLMFVMRRTRRTAPPWPVAHHDDQQGRKVAQASLDIQEALRQDMATLRNEATEIRARLESIEHLLKSVD